MNRFQTMHNDLWALRKEIGHERYPIPGREDCLAFAVTEAAEALDAYLEQKGGWVRNNPEAKHKDEYREWAQCAMMLMLALGEEYKYTSVLPLREQPREYIVRSTTGFLVYGVNDKNDELEVEWTIEQIDIHCVGIDTHFEQELNRLRDKWLTKQTA